MGHQRVKLVSSRLCLLPVLLHSGWLLTLCLSPSLSPLAGLFPSSLLLLVRFSPLVSFSLCLLPFLSRAVCHSLLPSPPYASARCEPLSLPLSASVSCSLLLSLSPCPLLCHLQPVRASISHLDHVSSFLVFSAPGACLMPGPAVPIAWVVSAGAWRGQPPG